MYKFFKRSVDIILSGSMLIILSPVFFCLVLAIRKNMGKPAIFKQQRPGLQGKLFTMYKFRSMTDERDVAGRLLTDDERMTNFGRMLRKLSIDELPELWNIFIGDMSFVGPRPQLVRDMVFFDAEVMKRQSVLPGLTGWAQINGRNAISWEDKFKYDLEYVAKRNFLFDAKIFFLTFAKVLKSEGVSAEGMETSEDYGDYLLRTGQISEEEYSNGMAQSATIICSTNNV